MRFAALLKKIREYETRHRGEEPSESAPADAPAGPVNRLPSDAVAPPPGKKKSKKNTTAVIPPPETWISDLEIDPYGSGLVQSAEDDSASPLDDLMDRVESELQAAPLDEGLDLDAADADAVEPPAAPESHFQSLTEQEKKDEIADLLNSLDAPVVEDEEPAAPADPPDVLDDETITRIIDHVPPLDEDDHGTPPSSVAEVEETESDADAIDELEALSESIQRDIVTEIHRKEAAPETMEEPVAETKPEDETPASTIADSLQPPSTLMADELEGEVAEIGEPGGEDEIGALLNDLESMSAPADATGETEDGITDAELDREEAEAAAEFEQSDDYQQEPSVADSHFGSRDELIRQMMSGEPVDDADLAGVDDVARDESIPAWAKSDSSDVPMEEPDSRATVIYQSDDLGDFEDFSAAPVPPEEEEARESIVQALTAEDATPEQRAENLRALLDMAMEQASRGEAQAPAPAAKAAAPRMPAPPQQEFAPQQPAPQHYPPQTMLPVSENRIESLLSLLNERQRELAFKVDVLNSRLNLPQSNVKDMDNLLQSMEESEIESVLNKLMQGDIDKDEVPAELLNLLQAMDSETGGSDLVEDLQQTILGDDALLKEGDSIENWDSRFAAGEDLGQTIVTDEASLAVGDELEDWNENVRDLDEAGLEAELDRMTEGDVDADVREALGAELDAETPGEPADEPAAESEAAAADVDVDDLEKMLAEAGLGGAVEPDAEDVLAEGIEPGSEVDYESLDKFFSKIDEQPGEPTEDEGVDIITRLMGRSKPAAPADAASMTPVTVAPRTRVVQSKAAEEYSDDFLEFKFEEFEFIEDEDITAEKESLLDLQTLQSILNSVDEGAVEETPMEAPNFDALRAAIEEEEETTLVVEAPKTWKQWPAALLVMFWRVCIEGTREGYRALNRRIEEYFPKTPGMLFRPIPFLPALRDVVGAVGIFLVISMTILIVRYFTLALM